LIDGTIASGGVFKIVNVFEANGAARYPDSNNPQSYAKILNIFRQDLSLLSESDRGNLLKQRGNQLIDFSIHGITASENDPEDKEFLREIGLEPYDVDPVGLAMIFTEKIAAYGKLSNAPDWVCDPTKRSRIVIQGRQHPLNFSSVSHFWLSKSQRQIAVAQSSCLSLVCVAFLSGSY
jgi:hypothetical protein